MNPDKLALVHKYHNETFLLSEEATTELLENIALTDNFEALLGFISIRTADNPCYCGENLKPLLVAAMKLDKRAFLTSVLEVTGDVPFIEVAVEQEKLELAVQVWKDASVGASSDLYENMWYVVLRSQNKLHLAEWLEERCPITTLDPESARREAKTGGAESLKYLAARSVVDK